MLDITRQVKLEDKWQAAHMADAVLPKLVVILTPREKSYCCTASGAQHCSNQHTIMLQEDHATSEPGGHVAGSLNGRRGAAQVIRHLPRGTAELTATGPSFRRCELLATVTQRAAAGDHAASEPGGHVAGSLHGRRGAAQAGGHLPVLASLAQPQEADFHQLLPPAGVLSLARCYLLCR